MSTATGFPMASSYLEAKVIEDQHGYPQFEQYIRACFQDVKAPIFTTDADPDYLWDCYLESIPQEHQQHYKCNCCRRFIQNFGGLAVIGDNGVHIPLVWDSAAWIVPFFENAIKRLHTAVAKAKVNGVFLSSEKLFGTPVSEPTQPGKMRWTHIHAINPARFVDKLLTADQKMAERKQEFQMIRRALDDFTTDQVRTAVAVLAADAIGGSEKALGIGRWYLNLRESIDGTKNTKIQNNLIWKAIATAPPGYAHVRTTMIKTLLDDIAAGYGFEVIRRNWLKLMAPQNYQRPKAAPTEGQIKVAEKLVEKLGIQRSLDRRYATLKDLRQILWVPRIAPEIVKTEGGIFDILRPKAAASNVILPKQDITWVKFAKDVLPMAHEIKVQLPIHKAFYVGTTTQTNADAPPIIQWDEENNRNPVGNYIYINGSTAHEWNLSVGWHKANAVFRAPQNQVREFTHQGDYIVFSFEQARDLAAEQGAPTGLGLFPAMLKAELREMHTVIEAYSQKGKITGVGNANGIIFKKEQPLLVRVNGNRTFYIDRWE